MKYLYAIREAIEELIEEKNAYVLGEDIREPYGGAFKVTKGLSEKYPENIIGTPMCEQGFTAVSIGMALMGEYVLEEIMFGDFITLTADQLINHGAKFYDLYGQKLHLVVRTPSGGYRGYGATHSQSLEKMFLGIPGLKVAAPNRFIHVGEYLKYVIESGKPTLFIENKLDYPKELILEDNDIFQYEEKDYVVRLSIKGETPDITILTYGGLSSKAVKVARDLIYNEEISADVVVAADLSDAFFKGKDSPLIQAVRTKNVVVAEEGTGGYGFAAQAAFEFAQAGRRAAVLTSKESIIPSGRKAEEEVLVSEDDIYRKVKAFCMAE